MKKSSLVVALPALVLSGLLLSGCGMFRSHKAWETARQEAPLEIPPGLDTPPASDALVIPPPGANNPTSTGVTADVGGGTGGVITDGFTLSDNVDNAYRRVGDAIAAASLGEVVAHDDAAHTYTMNVTAAAARKRGFFGRLFHRNKGDDAAAGTAPRQVQVTINGSGTSASEVRAQGPAPAVAKVIDGLKSKLGS